MYSLVFFRILCPVQKLVVFSDEVKVQKHPSPLVFSRAPHTQAICPFGGKQTRGSPQVSDLRFSLPLSFPSPTSTFHLSPSCLPYAFSFCGSISLSLLGRKVSKLQSSDSFGGKWRLSLPIH